MSPKPATTVIGPRTSRSGKVKPLGKKKKEKHSRTPRDTKCLQSSQSPVPTLPILQFDYIYISEVFKVACTYHQTGKRDM